jgi:dTDP-4-dehydrorhamnose reductase
MVVGAIEEVAYFGPVLILGASGMLGHALQQVIPNAIAFGHERDITERDRITTYIQDLRPAIVINAAAYTDVDGCEDHPEYAMLVNGTAPGYLAAACKKVDAVLIHYSTDYVFDGTKEEYYEDEVPHPLNVYGASKFAGEGNVVTTTDDYRLIRTSWLFGPYGKNFVDTILDLSAKLPQVKVVNDQFGRPTYTLDLALATTGVIVAHPGIYHLTNEGTCSWYEFARAFIPNAIPCTTAEFPRRAKRPRCSVLASSKTEPLRSWREALSDYLKTKGKEVLS